jgi:phosphate transport system substrate-binding protein
VNADIKSMQAALTSTPMTDDMIVWMPDPAGKDSYPIVSYTWLLAYKNYQDPAKAKALKDVIRYGLTEGQKVSEEMGYIPFSDEVAKKVLAHVDDIKP